MSKDKSKKVENNDDPESELDWSLSEDEDDAKAADGDEAKASDDGDDAKAADGDEAKASDDGDEAKASDDDDEAEASEDDDEAEASDDGDEEAKASEDDDEAKASDDDADDSSPAVEHHAAHDHAAHDHAPDRKEYWKVWGALLALTVLEVGVAYVKADKVLLVSALMGLAVAKAAIVALFYMHLKHETKVMKWTVALPMAFPALYAFILIAEGIFRSVWGAG